jgi:anti-anti-sigma regulatory factor
MFLDSQLQGRVLTLQASGRWLIENLPSIEAEFATIAGTPARSLVIDTTGLEELDLSGAWALFERLRRLEQSGMRVSWRGRKPDQLRIVEQRLTGEARTVMTVGEGLDLPTVRSLGRWASPS